MKLDMHIGRNIICLFHMHLYKCVCLCMRHTHMCIVCTMYIVYLLHIIRV